IRFVSDDEAAALGLRRPPRRAGTIRVVEVEGWDRSACGGTHVNRTGELGPVLLRRWERTKGQIRVEFLSGWRAIADYRWKHALRELTGREACVVLAGDEATGRLYFARSPGAGPAMAALIDQASRSVGGRGGGTAEFAQGAVPPGDTVARALAHAEEAVRGA